MELRGGRLACEDEIPNNCVLRLWCSSVSLSSAWKASCLGLKLGGSASHGDRVPGFCLEYSEQAFPAGQVQPRIALTAVQWTVIFVAFFFGFCFLFFF